MNAYIYGHPSLRRDFAMLSLADLKAEVARLTRLGDEVIGWSGWDNADLGIKDPDLLKRYADCDFAADMVADLTDYIDDLPSLARPVRGRLQKVLNDRLRFAAACGRVDDCAALLAHGADVNSVDKGWTALQDAVINGHPAVCALLLANGADSKALGIGMLTAVQLAVAYGQPLVVDYFIREQGEDLDQVTYNGKTFEDIAAGPNGDPVMAAHLQSLRAERSIGAISAALYLPAENEGPHADAPTGRRRHALSL